MDLISSITSEQIGIASVLVTIIAFVIALVYFKSKNINITLQDLMVRSLSASSLPTALVILACAIDTSLLSKLGGLLQVYIALAGLSLAYISLVALFSPLSKNNAHSENKDG